MVLHEHAPVGTAPLVLEDRAAPEPGPGEIRVKALCCGVCHTDLHVVKGELKPPLMPLIPGHQVVGVVDQAGEGCSRFRTGDRVGMAWLHRACGQCVFCLEGLENLCPGAAFTGFSAHGGFAEYTLVPEDFAYTIPDVFEPRDAAPLLCAGIIGYRCLRLSGIKPGGRLGLYGFGAAAHIAIQVALHWGIDVFVFTRSEEHRNLARRLGAVWTGRAEDAPPARMHGSIIFAPAGPLVPTALEHLEKGGTVALGGIYMSPVPELDYTRHLYDEKILRSVTASTRQDGEELLAVAAEIPIRTETQAFALEDANRALLQLEESRINGAAVLQVG
jgi:propanol-preferring alcohol dehydrogenase